LRGHRKNSNRYAQVLKAVRETCKFLVNFRGVWYLGKQKIKNSDSHVMWYFCRAPGGEFLLIFKLTEYNYLSMYCDEILHN
jgi:hypothetical protein